jgi:hypothetical protein
MLNKNKNKGTLNADNFGLGAFDETHGARWYGDWSNKLPASSYEISTRY